jgi:uncharacterized sporulation protein YeaH/YhbH (DUF444 family)
MSDSPVKTSFIFVDRRKTGRGKSLPNRQKLLKRIKDSIKNAKPQDLDATGVMGAGNSNKKFENPVKVARDALSEPTFRYASGSGEHEIVLPGNDVWEKGDPFPVQSGEGGPGNGKGEGAGQGNGNGEDDFIVNISRSEFYDAFFEDCELPDLEQTSEKVLPEAVWKPAGFQKEGNPGQMSVIRSYRNSLGRRKALNAEAYRRIEELEAEMDRYNTGTHGQCQYLSLEEIGSIIYGLAEEIAALRSKIAATPFFEKIDLRFRKSEKVQVKSSDAVLVMAMDVSASMDEEKKRLARKYFVLQYAFIKRSYPDTDLIFIYHTDEAYEVTEDEFFTSRVNGGTVISSAMDLTNKILTERYDASQTNLYFSYAGDGDNWNNDNARVQQILQNEGLLKRLRHAVYLQVGQEMSWSAQSQMWEVMQKISAAEPKLHIIKVHSDDEVFSAFKSVYGSKKNVKA